MKIGQPADKPATQGVGTGRAASTTGSAAPAQPAGEGVESSAKVALSSAAATLISQQDVDAEFDAEKVARVAQAVSEGTYKVNAEVIADKLLSNAQELLGKVAP